ncbi:MAG: PilZ domain-containing protein [Acidobacteriia bacterium]|nr:PilZ domain-containing protein [Terriglobia bacterium]
MVRGNRGFGRTPGALAFRPAEDYTPLAMRERRQVPRYIAGFSAVLTPHDTGAESEVAVEVISVRGCCVKGAGTPEAGRECRLAIPWQGKEIHTEAQVTWKDARGLAGLRFLNMDQESSETLRSLCATLRLQPLAPMSADVD